MTARMARIGDICETGSGGTPLRANAEAYYGGEIPWVKSGELQDTELMSTVELITERGLKESSSKLVPKGSVLVAMYGATVGKTALLGIEAATNQAICHVMPDPNQAEASYVWYALRSKVPELLSKRVGGAQPNISQEIIRNTRIPLPPLPEQRRIVEILDQADALRKLRSDADVLAQRILPALFYKMFGDPVRNTKSLPKKKLGELIKVKSGEGIAVKDLHPSKGYPVYGGNGINGYNAEYMFDQPVVVIGRVGVYCGAVYYTQPRCWVTDNALFVTKKSDQLVNRYLVEALRMANLNQYAGRAGQPLISGSRIYPVEILVPSPDAQREFGRQVEQLEENMLNRAKSREQLELLFKVLLHRAFTGELTKGWREENNSRGRVENAI